MNHGPNTTVVKFAPLLLPAGAVVCSSGGKHEQHGHGYFKFYYHNAYFCMGFGGLMQYFFLALIVVFSFCMGQFVGVGVFKERLKTTKSFYVSEEKFICVKVEQLKP